MLWIGTGKCDRLIPPIHNTGKHWSQRLSPGTQAISGAYGYLTADAAAQAEHLLSIRLPASQGMLSAISLRVSSHHIFRNRPDPFHNRFCDFFNNRIQHLFLRFEIMVECPLRNPDRIQDIVDTALLISLTFKKCCYRINTSGG